MCFIVFPAIPILEAVSPLAFFSDLFVASKNARSSAFGLPFAVHDRQTREVNRRYSEAQRAW